MSSDRRLLRLLNGSAERLERHLSRHPEDAERLDALTALDEGIVGGLHRATRADGELRGRLTDAFTFDESTRALAATMGDLMALGIRTMSALASSESMGIDPTTDETTPAIDDRGHDEGEAG
jgi:hypothetical protein